MTLSIPWEPLGQGPSGEYLEVLDIDESGKRVHPPVNLDDARLLATDGLTPSDGNPQFRQQMVYAVAMRTIRNFERALGRPAQWPPRVAEDKTIDYQRQLRLCPHYFQESNAHYHTDKGLFCFGYFTSLDDSPYPGTTIYTCLSQDVTAHELSHALLLGMNFEPGADLGPRHQRVSRGLLRPRRPAAALRPQRRAARPARGDPRQPRRAERPRRRRAAVRPGAGPARRNPQRAWRDGRWPMAAAQGRSQAVQDDYGRRTTAGDILVACVFDAFKKILRVAHCRSPPHRDARHRPAAGWQPSPGPDQSLR